MGLLNLTLTQFLAVLLPLAAGLVALYFYDRSRRRVRVSTLRFWPRHSSSPVVRRHKKIQQPWSLLLQLLAALLLLLAIADFRWGASENPHHHAIVLDGSAAMLYRSSSGGPVMEQGRQRALAYLDALPASDLVALIRADASPSVLVGFTDDRPRLRQAIRDFTPGWTALRLDAALELAQSSLYLAIGEPIDGAVPASLGETTYIGPGRLEPGTAPVAQPSYLRFIAVDRGLDDLGIVRFAAARPAAEPELWQVALEVFNDSQTPHQTTAAIEFESRPIGQRSVQIPPHESVTVEFRIRTSGAGTLEASLNNEDGLPENNRVALQLPAAPRLPTALLTSRVQAWRSLVSANPAITLTTDAAALTIADRRASVPAAQVWIDPQPGAAPIEIGERLTNVRITSWAPGHPATQGLRETDLRLSAASVLLPQPNDAVLVETSDGPIAVARESNGQRQVILGFDLLDPAIAGRLTSPLLFANILSWFAPEIFQTVAVEARPPGVLQLPIGAFDDSRITVDAPGGQPVWMRHGDDLRLFQPARGLVRVRTPAQDSRISMTLPAPGQAAWEPPSAVRRGLPQSSAGIAGFAFWPWMSLLAAALLFVDWRLFGNPAPAAGEAVS